MSDHSDHSHNSDWKTVDEETEDALARFLIGHIDWEHAPGGGETWDQF
jgi:hypothetical protein